MAKEVKMQEITSIEDLIPDPHNANKGTQRGRGMLETSIKNNGLGRSILADRNGVVIAGNKTLEASVGTGMEDVIVVQTDGTKLVVVQRTDLDMSKDKRAKALAIADNRTSEMGLEWDTDVLADLNTEGVLDGLFFEDELDALLSMPDGDDWANAMGALPDGDKSPFEQMTFTLSNEQAQTVKAAMEKARRMGAFVDTGNENGNGNALNRVCEVFLGV